MKKFENLFDENLEFFNTEEPSAGHFEKFGLKLQAQNRRIILRRKLYSVTKIAAIIIVVVFSAVIVKYNQTRTSESNISRIEKSKEMNEDEQFYSRMLEQSYENIRQIKFPDEAQKTKMIQEVTQKDESYTKMKEQLLKDPSNEMAQQAMVNYYETRLEVVNQIVANLKLVLNSNS